MKHIVAISIVFFSLTQLQLVKAERAEGLRLFAEGLYQQQNTSSQQKLLQNHPSQEDQNAYFLSSDELSRLGISAPSRVSKPLVKNQKIGSLTPIGTPSNNSP